MLDERVRPPVEPLTEQDARHLLAEGLLRPCQDFGPTRVGLKMGCDEKTVRKARDKDTTLRLDYAWNALLANDRALDALAGHFHFKLVRIDPGADVGRSTASCITKLLLELSVALEDGRVDDHELAAMRGALDEAGSAIDAMRERLRVRAA